MDVQGCSLPFIKTRLGATFSIPLEKENFKILFSHQRFFSYVASLLIYSATETSVKITVLLCSTLRCAFTLPARAAPQAAEYSQ